MGKAYGLHRKDEKFITKFWSENLTGRGHLKDTSIDGRIIIKWILEK
jgi:hypothetical protein